MVHPTTSGWRRALAALLVAVLAVAGAGRATATVATSVALLPGLQAPICHSGQNQVPDDPAAPPHDCCDDCALLSPAVLPSNPPAVSGAVAWHVADRSIAGAPAITLSRQRGSRRARGPPRG